jgi:predicted phosphodiesterase
VLRDVEDDAAIIIGGDVAAGPWPHETLERLRSIGDRVHWLRGNADRELAQPLCHATPRDDEEILTRISPDERWREVLAGVEERTVVCGHTHVQFDRTVDGTRLLNAGSVGMPCEDQPGAYWLAIGDDVEFRRSEYDVEAMRGSLDDIGWPDEWPSATPAEATEFFEKLARGER